MQIDFTEKYKRQHQSLPKEIQKRADKQLALLLENPRHPSLRFHKMHGWGDMWEISVTMSYRIIFRIKEDVYVLEQVGKHDILKKR